MLLLLLPAGIGGLLTLLLYVVVFLIIVGLLFWSVNKLCAAFGIGEPIHTVLVVGLVIIVVIGLIYIVFGGGSGIPLR